MTHPIQSSEEQFRNAAVWRYASDDIVFDDNAEIDTSPNDGAWVTARVWVPNPKPLKKPVMYRHYFSAPLTGNFVSRHKNFDQAWEEFRSCAGDKEGLYCWIIDNSRQSYTLANVEPCDMPNNPERLEEDRQ